MKSYYAEKLSAHRLRACYELAPPPVQAYLEAEIAFVLERTVPAQLALELGCGYGRVLKRLAGHVRAAIGIDTSLASLRLGQELPGSSGAAHFLLMDASRMGFRDRTFDLSVCVQNGICAFHVGQRQLFAEAVRVTRSGGTVLFSSYSPRFWEHRLEWFEIQAAHGLIGEIDRAATRDGVIVCRDGFRATSLDAAGFAKLAGSLGLVSRIVEVEGASLFCEVIAP